MAGRCRGLQRPAIQSENVLDTAVSLSHIKIITSFTESAPTEQNGKGLRHIQKMITTFIYDMLRKTISLKGVLTMLNIQEMQKKVGNYHYWDSRILDITAKYFGDEVIIRLEEDDAHDLVYTFLGCDRVEMKHWFGYPKFGPIKNYTRGQIPYFTQDIKVHEEEHAGEHYYVFVMDLHPMYMTVYCRDLDVEIVENLSRLKDNDSTK